MGFDGPDRDSESRGVVATSPPPTTPQPKMRRIQMNLNTFVNLNGQACQWATADSELELPTRNSSRACGMTAFHAVRRDALHFNR